MLVEHWEAELVWEAAEAEVDRDAETRASISRNRRFMGLSADAAVVEHFFRQDKEGRDQDPRWLTDTEGEALDRRDAKLEAGAEAVAAYVDAHRDAFAGKWLRWSDGVPTLVLAFARDLDDHHRALAEIHPHPEVVEVVERPTTLEVLRARLERTEEGMEGLAELGITWDSMGIDEEHNHVELEIFAPDEGLARRAIAERLGDGLAITYLGSETTAVAPVAWQLWSVDDSGRQLTVYYATNATYERHSVEYDERQHSVEVTVFESMSAGSTRLPGATRQATITLSDALGDRTVIDGSSSAERPRKPTRPPPG